MYWSVSGAVLVWVLFLEGVYVQEQWEIDPINALIEVNNYCKCVKNHYCDDDNFIITDGRNLFDRRVRLPVKRIQCQGGTFPYEIVCCKLRDDNTTSSTERTTDSSTATSTMTTTITTTKSIPSVRNYDIDHKVVIDTGGDTCGVQRAIINTRILSGDDDLNPLQGEFPWIAAIFKKTSTGGYKFLCSGSLIHPNVVLTINHCVIKKKTSDLRVVVNGKLKLSEPDATQEEKRDVSEIVSHPSYDDRLLFNDAALLLLERPFVVDTWSHINTLCLPPRGVNLDGKKCLVTGWGEDNIGQRSKILKKVEVPFVNHTQCQTLLRSTRLGKRFHLDKSFMCAGGEKGRDACMGDGGSPLMCATYLGSDQYFQAGMVSWGIDCGKENVPGVYTDVSEAVEWIKNELNNRQLYL